MRMFTKTAAALSLISAVLGGGAGDAEARSMPLGGPASVAGAGAATGRAARSALLRNADCSNRRNLIDEYYTRGMRVGRRSMREAMEFCRTQVPLQIRAEGKDAARRFFRGKDASHKVAHARGGSSEPRNLVMEDSSTNRARGDRNMTGAEIREAEAAVRSEGRATWIRRIPWKPAVGAGGGAGFALAAIPEALCGKPAGEVAERGIWGALIGAAATTAGVAIMAAVPLTIPFVAPALKAGAVVGVGATAYDSYRAATDPARCER